MIEKSETKSLCFSIMGIDQVINLLAAMTLIVMMGAIGLGVTLEQVLGLAADIPLLLRAALANYILVPAAAVGLLMLFDAKPLVAAGFLIAAVCPGAPFGPPFTAMAKGNVPMAVGLMVVLAGSSALVAPWLLHLLMPLVGGGDGAQVDTGRLLMTLFGAQLVPLSIGLAVRRWGPLLAARLTSPLGRLSAILNVTTFTLIIAVNLQTLLEIRPVAYGGMLALVLLSLAAGWLLGGSRATDRKAMAMATSVRNVGVAMVIATGSFPGTPAVTAATAFAVFQTLVMLVIALAWGRMA